MSQSIFHCDSATIPATAAESGLFVLWSACCKALKHALLLPDKQHFEGRVLTQKANDEQTMREQLAIAPLVTLTATLRPR